MIFELGVTDAEAARHAIEPVTGAEIVGVVETGPAGGNPCVTINAADETAAFAAVDAIYDRAGLNPTSIRDPNGFYVYGRS